MRDEPLAAGLSERHGAHQGAGLALMLIDGNARTGADVVARRLPFGRKDGQW